MNPAQPPPRKENLIQGPRPTPLRVSKDSFKIKKPPKPPQPPPYLPPSTAAPAAGNQPVIIYSVSPKPYLVEASDFRSLVQHLTGRSTAAPETSTAGGEPPVSPAARLAAMERTSPKERDWRRGGAVAETTAMTDVDFGGEMSMPGILSPAPENLSAVITPGMFTTEATTTVAGEGHSYFGMGELMSPYMSNTAFLPSPSALLFSNTPVISPSVDFYNIFDF